MTTAFLCTSFAIFKAAAIFFNATSLRTNASLNGEILSFVFFFWNLILKILWTSLCLFFGTKKDCNFLFIIRLSHYVPDLHLKWYIVEKCSLVLKSSWIKWWVWKGTKGISGKTIIILSPGDGFWQHLRWEKLHWNLVAKLVWKHLSLTNNDLLY